MIAKLYEHRKHFREVYRWWKIHRNTPLDIGSLSEVGVTIWEGETMLACTWVFLGRGSTVAQLGWSVSNPDISMRTAYEAVQESIARALILAKDNGCNRAITMSSSKGLTRVFQKAGFTKQIPHDMLVRTL